MNKRQIKRLLIANRGEIALRVIRACRELGIVSVAVFSEPDRTSLHVLSADEAYPLGGTTPGQSYLNQSRILEIAVRAGVDAIHPGYGFLAENPVFAELAVNAGILFVGPSSDSIRLMGDKTQARKVARRLGIPTIAGTDEPLKDSWEGLRRTAEIGFPILLKAAAGGGGKGMRVVRSAEDFHSAFRMAQSEAKSAFGDDRIFIEKYLDSPRHIEVQIIGDSLGNVIYLGERECSIQRRHQKIIEESPSSAVNEVLRRELGEAAVMLAKAAHYVNAGTMEFLLDTSGKYYFLEMNTRLQVEHPVTEELTGIDLVKTQIRMAQGEPLPLEQHQLTMRGHAIECRICAEDPDNAFMPSMGELVRYQLPEGRIRVENGFRQGDTVTVHYDSLMSKIIAWGATRTDSIAVMERALHEFVIEGIKSTIPFCKFVLKHQDFIKGNYDTRFVDKNFVHTSSGPNLEDQRLAAVAAAVLIGTNGKLSPNHVENNAPRASSKWRSSRGDVLRS